MEELMQIDYFFLLILSDNLKNNITMNGRDIKAAINIKITPNKSEGVASLISKNI